jgi:glutathione S-transferase
MKLYLQFLTLLIILYNSYQCVADLSLKRIKLFYFDAKGSAELIRILLQLTNTPFEDIRYNLVPNDNGKYEINDYLVAKSQGEFAVNLDRVPVLEVDEIKLGQSRVIERYICACCSLLGSTQEEAAIIECIAENICNIKDQWIRLQTPAATDKQFQIEKWFQSGEMVQWLERLEKSLPLKHAEEESHWFAVGNRLSYADIAIWQLLRDYFPIDKSTIKLYEKQAKCFRLSKVADKVSEMSRLKTYLQQRKQTLF